MALDNFTGADGTLLAIHDSDWVDLNGTYLVSKFKLTSSACGTTSTYALAGAIYSTSTADSSQIVIKAVTATVNKFVCIRSNSTNNYGYSARFIYTSGNWVAVSIYKNGSQVAIVSGLTLPATSDHTLLITATGTSPLLISVFIDGSTTAAVTYSDSSPLIAGSPGFYVVGNGVSANNNFDDWTDGVSAGGSFTGTYAASQAAQSQSAAALLSFAGSTAQSQSSQSQILSALLQFTGSTAEMQAANSEAIAGVLGFTGTVAQTQAQQAEAIYQALLAITGAVSQSQAAQIASLAASLAFGGVSEQVQAAQSEALAAVLSFAGSTAQSQQLQTETLAALLSFGGEITQAQAIQIEALQAILAFGGSVDQTQAQQRQIILEFIAAIILNFGFVPPSETRGFVFPVEVKGYIL